MSPASTTRRGNPRARHALGRAAEDLAARYLQQHGCTVLVRRFGRRGGEVDLIVEDSGVLAFVEVKARSSRRFGSPIEAVTRRKQGRLVSTARAFLADEQWRGRRCRFDVVGVQLSQGTAEVRWVRDAFRP